MNPIQLQDLQVIADSLGDLINVGWNLTHGGSLFSAWVLSGDFSKISLFKKEDVLSGFKSLDEATRQSLEQRLVAKVNLPKDAQIAFSSGVGVFERGVKFTYSLLDLYESGKQIVLDAGALFGVKA